MKSDPGMRFAPAWNKAVSFGNATEECLCSRIFTYNGNGIPMHKFLSSAVFEVGPLLVPCSLLDIRPLLRPSAIAGTLSVSGPLPIGGNLTTAGSWNSWSTLSSS
jgi:hypothetical protein